MKLTDGPTADDISVEQHNNRSKKRSLTVCTQLPSDDEYELALKYPKFAQEKR